jgi:hypothetical protein
VLYIDVAIVDRDVAHVVMVIHYVSSECYKYFICSRQMLQVFYLDIAKVDLDVAYTCMLQVYVSSVLRCFIHMFGSVSSGYWMLCMFAIVFKCF